ncbi:MAG: helix-turn-helix transcriptional regulator [Solobacterium sp.]|nr:helix-turn-helix transcriptional regulator [Solobacterium sp.]
MTKKYYRSRGLASIPYEAEEKDIIFETPDGDIRSSWSLNEFHRVPGEEVSRIPKHWHRALEIIIPVSANAEVWISSKRHIVEPGNMIIVNCGVIHESRRQDYSLAYYGYALQYSRDFLQSMVDDFDMLSFPEEPLPLPDGLLDNIRNALSSSRPHDEYDRLRTSLLMNRFLLFLLENYARRSVDAVPEAERDIVYLAMSRIEAEAYTELSLQNLADALHVSYAYLSRRFRSRMGMTMLEYRDRIRIETARRLLTTGEPLESIARSLGYKGYTQFSRTFQQYCSCTPAAYRKNKS